MTTDDIGGLLARFDRIFDGRMLQTLEAFNAALCHPAETQPVA